jgi:alkanesulfonate monooxygenase SsuD/methylene tetrahydromethanopterin reductase-like flavin-dependent oxidoreductase (luciferase family)
MRFGLTAEFRNPPQWARPSAEVYADIIDHMVWAESLGFEDAFLLEHHFTDDGYIPSPLITATAIAARTKKMRVFTNIVILPLYDPVKLAEDGAVIDVISNGRLDLGVGLGYRPEEFAGYGIDLKTRGSRANEALEIIRRLWHGEKVTFHGKHFDIDGAEVTPRPVQQPNPPISVGGFGPASVRRAAKYGDGYIGPANKQMLDMYREELRKLGKDPAKARVSGGLHGLKWLVVSRDPERDFNLFAPSVMYWYNSYAKWFEGTDTQMWPHVDSVDDLRRLKLINVVTPDEAVKRIKRVIAEVPMESLGFSIAPPALPVSKVTDNIELFAKTVMPHFQ